jgi:hypothetical protein
MSPRLSVDIAADDFASDDEYKLNAGGNIFNKLAHRIGLTAQQPRGNYVGIQTDIYFFDKTILF